MAGCDPGLLSPRLVEERSAELPFGLTVADLEPLLIGHDAGSPYPHAVRVVTRYELRGLHQRGGSRVVTLRHESFGAAGELDVFLKLAPSREAELCVALSRAGVPIPSLLFDFAATDDNHVLGFEFLPTIGIDFASEAEITELLAVIAALNACSAAVLGSTAQPPPGGPEEEFTERVAAALAVAWSSELLSWATPVQLMDVYVKSQRWASAMPTAVTHGEMHFQHVGRRQAGSLVMFDLATVGVRPRFSDLCSLLSGMGRECAMDEVDAFAAYLKQLAAAGAATPSVEEGIGELRRLRVLSCFQSLPWLARSLDAPDLGAEALANNVETLRRDLVDLGVVGSR